MDFQTCLCFVEGRAGRSWLVLMERQGQKFFALAGGYLGHVGNPVRWLGLCRAMHGYFFGRYTESFGVRKNSYAI
ncbi:MAG TPA: hypothetical protein DCQ80_16305 [Pseudomonas sp.]|nr:hypothetical protein [Pseudomonas sp.]